MLLLMILLLLLLMMMTMMLLMTMMPMMVLLLLLRLLLLMLLHGALARAPAGGGGGQGARGGGGQDGCCSVDVDAVGGQLDGRPAAFQRAPHRSWCECVLCTCCLFVSPSLIFLLFSCSLSLQSVPAAVALGCFGFERGRLCA